jgi:hypothetical protein
MNEGFKRLLKASSELNSFAFIRGVRGHAWAAGNLPASITSMNERARTKRIQKKQSSADEQNRGTMSI